MNAKYARKTILSWICLCIVLIYICQINGCTRGHEKKQITVIIRLDDYSSLGSTELELKIFDVFRNNGAALTIGVIPFVSKSVYDPFNLNFVPLSPEKRDILQAEVRNGVVDVALHGYSHQQARAERRTEFSGLEYSLQVEKLGKGKKYIEDITKKPITTFIPPWNNYDENTVNALEYLGFTTISASNGGEANENGSLKYLPCTCDLFHLRDAIRLARKSPDARPILVVLAHEYDFIKNNEFSDYISLREFSDLITWLKSQNDIRLLSVSQAVEVVGDLGVKRYLRNISIHKLLDMLPQSILEGYRSQYFDGNASLIKIYVCLGLFYFIYIILCACVCFAMAYYIFPRLTVAKYIGGYGGLIITISIIGYTIYDHKIYFKGIMACVGAIGLYCGILLYLLYHKQKGL
jgi:peptidoglycan/xylan/chitin deacetylase (PgdA/CDA1 family)